MAGGSLSCEHRLMGTPLMWSVTWRLTTGEQGSASRVGARRGLVLAEDKVSPQGCWAHKCS